MQSLEKVITALREDVSHAIVENKPLPGNVRLEAERVVVTLAFAIEQNGAATAFNFETDSAPNSLSIEFRCKVVTGQTAEERPSVIPQKARNAEITGEEAESVTQQLSQVFGSPGFDSSARATVFREAFENLSDAESGALIESFSSRDAGTDSAGIKRSVGLIRRVCEAGPAGFNNAKKILARIFAEHTAAPVLDLIARVWKTQQQWLD